MVYSDTLIIGDKFKFSESSETYQVISLKPLKVKWKGKLMDHIYECVNVRVIKL